MNAKIEPTVTIVCLTYNHEKYIRKTLEGFLLQKTDFPFEVLINDDCSTDGTAQIIREYEMRYPDIIHPVYQEENLYRQEISAKSVLGPLVNGKYVALCEGDDYWTDSAKLQIQVDYLESNPSYSLRMHAADTVAEDGSYLRRSIPMGNDFDITTEQLILSDVFTQTASMVMRSSYYKQLSVIGDYPTKIELSLLGKVHLINRSMSAYRTNADGSWSVRIRSDEGLAKKHYSSRKRYLEELDARTCGRFSDTIKRKKLEFEFAYLIKTKQYERRNRNKYQSIYKHRKGRSRIIFWLQVNHPQLFWIIKRY